MQQLKSILLKDFDHLYLEALKKHTIEFLPVYKSQFEQVFDQSLLTSHKSLFISSQNTIKALLHHHVHSIDKYIDVYIVGPKTGSYFEDCFSLKPKLIGNNAEDLISQINTLGNDIQEPVLFLCGHQHHDAIPDFLENRNHTICPMYSIEYIINTDYFSRYLPETTILVVFAPEMAKRIPKKDWHAIVAIGPTTKARLNVECPVYEAKEPTPKGLSAILDEIIK